MDSLYGESRLCRRGRDYFWDAVYVCNDRVTECTRVRRVCTAATSGIPACTYAHVRAGYAQLVRLVWQTAGTRGCVMVTVYTYSRRAGKGFGLWAASFLAFRIITSVFITFYKEFSSFVFFQTSFLLSLVKGIIVFTRQSWNWWKEEKERKN